VEEFAEFEKVEVWQEARALAVLIYQHTERGGWTLDFVLRDETRKAVIGIGKEIARGYGLATHVDLRRQIRKARGICFTLVTLLHIGSDLGYVPKDEIKKPLQAVKTVVQMIDDVLYDVARRRRNR